MDIIPVLDIYKQKVVTAVEGNRNLLASKSFEKFSKKVSDNRRIMQSSIVVVLARYNY